jgi:CPA1 family monovalent cation:H+ antiporter
MLVQSVCGGILSGALVGIGLMLLSGKTKDPLVEITFTTLAAYGSFLLAERFHCSGVLATLTAGILFGNRALRGAVSAPGRVALESFWEYAAFLANSLIFLLIGAREAQQHFGAVWRPALVAIALVTLGRAVAIYPFCALFARTRLKIDVRHQHILFWGGLRGALALALALGLPQELPNRDEIVAVALAVVAFSVFVQGLTMAPLLRRLGQLPEPPSQGNGLPEGRYNARAPRGKVHDLHEREDAHGDHR